MVIQAPKSGQDCSKKSLAAFVLQTNDVYDFIEKSNEKLHLRDPKKRPRSPLEAALGERWPWIKKAHGRVNALGRQVALAPARERHQQMVLGCSGAIGSHNGLLLGCCVRT